MISNELFERLCSDHESDIRSSLVASPRSCPVCDAIERHDDDLAKKSVGIVDALMFGPLAQIGQTIRLLKELEVICGSNIIDWLEEKEVIGGLESAKDELPDGEAIADEIWRK